MTPNQEESYMGEMREHLGNAIYYLELSANIVEVNDDLNNGQSEKVNVLYEKTIEAKKLLENI